MSGTVIYFDGGGGGIRAAASEDGLEKFIKIFQELHLVRARSLIT